MSNEKLMQMINKTTCFLCSHGQLPVMKKVDRRIIQAENKLNRRLIGLQQGVEKTFIDALKKRGYIPRDMHERKHFISEILDLPFNEMINVVSDESLNGAAIGRQIAFEDLLDVGFRVTVNEFSERVQEKLWNKFYRFSEDTFSRIQGDFAKTLAEGYKDGYGIDEVSRNLRFDFKNLRDHRLRLIARTEIQGSQNEGSSETMREYDVRYKQWITADDDRVRGNNPSDEYDHVHLHGQVVEFDEPYSNGMMFPADRSGDIGDWINCRCTERPYVPKKGEVIMTTPYYP